jgi:hypothetical protein
MNEALVKTEPANALVQSAENEVTTQERLFALAQRKAQIYSQSSLVPQEYRGNIGNVLIAENMARRMGADTLMVMQNLYVVHGKPGWSAQFLVACFNSCGRFSAIKYKFSGEPGSDDYGCVAYCTELSTGDVIEGTKITWGMAKTEGWSTKSGSKWKSMPEQMFRYRAATFLIRSTAPEIGMGLLTKDELDDMPLQNGNGNGAQTAGIEGLKARLQGSEEPTAVVDLADVDAIDVEPEKAAEATEPASRDALYDEVLEVLGIKFEGDDDEIKKFLNGRKMGGMDVKALTALKAELAKL